MHRFSEFSTEHGPLLGEKVKTEAILGKEIEVLTYRIGQSHYQENSESSQYVQLQFKFCGEDNFKCLFTGSSVLIRQLEKYKDKLPFLTSVKRSGRCFTFV